MARIVLLTPARRFIANRFGLGYQVPLGTVFLGGPLLDAGHTVKLIDNDLYGWSHARLASEISEISPDYILLGHTGSTAAHTTCLKTATALRAAFPTVRIGYGGVYPSYADEASLRDCTALDVVVRGEAEQTVVDLIAAWENHRGLDTVAGITWRNGTTIQKNPARPPIQNLDAYRPAWELVDWSNYRLFGLGRSAGMQFSRGCPLTCTYCGQWMFWKKWRHRTPQNFVNEVRTLVERYGVKIIWLADENFAADADAAHEVLRLLVEANLDVSLNINMTAADVVRDAEWLPLYKAAGIDYVVMGVESLEDEVVISIRKNNPYAVSRRAVQLLRANKIISLVDIIYGLQHETPAMLADKFKKICALDADMLNCVYITPHFWTADGRATDPHEIIQTDTARWTYRNQVIAAPHLSPALLFAGIKITEGLFHLRPAALKRLFVGSDARVRKILRAWLGVGIRVVLGEIVEFIFATHFSPRGSVSEIAGVGAFHETPLLTSTILPTGAVLERLGGFLTRSRPRGHFLDKRRGRPAA